ncbi:hypothetical protein CEXT_752441 [Caerostris extrusa]|uniref:Uncharacterized protein n=1 Tax=Caerostris extrusa TaxID=172846 RepID=A0AAV4X235_CAEEX|nr:hypothetical protein CEXT_752441 [Caerostris extrusa]
MRKVGGRCRADDFKFKSPSLPTMRRRLNFYLANFCTRRRFSHSRPEWPGQCIVSAGSECSVGPLPVGVKFEPWLIVRGQGDAVLSRSWNSEGFLECSEGAACVQFLKN